MSLYQTLTFGAALIVPLIGGLAAGGGDEPRAIAGLAATVPAAVPPSVDLAGDPADTLYQQARDALVRGDNRQAARLFRRIVDEEPESEYAADALYWQAYALYRVGTTDALREALAALDLQRQRYPRAATLGDAEVLMVRIRGVLARGGDADAAQRVYEVAGGEDYEVSDDCPDEESDVRIAALNALMQMDAERALPTLERVLERRDECSATLRRKAVFIVADGESPAATAILLRVAREDPDPEVRQQAVFWLSEVDDPRAIDALEEILRESRDPGVLEKALFALSESDSESDRPGQILRRYALDASQPQDIREKAIFWLSEREDGGDVAFLSDLYESVDSQNLKERVLFAAGESNDPRAVDWLLGVAGDASQSMELREKALFWAGESDGEDVDARLIGLYDRIEERELKDQLLFVYSELDSPAAVEKLFQVARTETDPELRKKALFWLGESDDPRVPGFLEEVISQ